jgi:hypothetical protein
MMMMMTMMGTDDNDYVDDRNDDVDDSDRKR